MPGGRCLVLNSSFEFLTITSTWFDGVRLVSKGRAAPLASYESPARSERSDLPVPAVVVLKKYVRVGRRRQPFSFPTKRNVLIRDGFKCAYCRKTLSMGTVTRDHVFPLSRGGKDEMTNVVAACFACNGAKAARTPQEAGMTLHAQPRQLTDDEKVEAIVKTHRSHERDAWLTCLRKHGLSLF